MDTPYLSYTQDEPLSHSEKMLSSRGQLSLSENASVKTALLRSSQNSIKYFKFMTEK